MAINIIGAAAGLFCVFAVIPTLIPNPADDPDATKVRIGVGLTSLADRASVSPGGNVPALALWDNVGGFIARTDGDVTATIDSGQYADIIVIPTHKAGNSAPEYLSVSAAGDDAICIAYIALTRPDGSKNMWQGSIGSQCGADWYPSELVVTDDGHMPNCTWIDGNASGELLYQGMSMHLRDFEGTLERAERWNDRPALPCQSPPRFHMWTQLNSLDWIPTFEPPLRYNSPALTDQDEDAVLVEGVYAPDEPRPGQSIAMLGDQHDLDFIPGKRGRRRLNPSHRHQKRGGGAGGGGVFMEGHLVTSYFGAHSALAVCRSPTSRGPDFVSVPEGVFCDMALHEAWPLCSEAVAAACFDLGTNTMREGGGVRGRDVQTGRTVPVKAYHTTNVWK